MRRACTSRVASQVGRNRTGTGISAAGRGARWRSSSSWPRSSLKRRSSIPSSAAASEPTRIPAQLAMSACGAWPEGAEVTADEVLPCLELGELRFAADPGARRARRGRPCDAPTTRREERARGRPRGSIPGKPEAGLRRSLLLGTVPRPQGGCGAARPRAAGGALVGALHASVPRRVAPSRIAIASGQKLPRRGSTWIVLRISVDCTSVRCSSARVTASRGGRRPATRGRRRSRARTPMDAAHPLDDPRQRQRSALSSSWRASIARPSSREVSTRSATASHASGG